MSVFEKVAFKAPNFSVFDLSHDNKLTYDIGQVVDAFRMDVAPGERVRVSVEQLTRFAPLLAPTMHNFRLYVDSVFVPYRILGKPYEDAFNYAKPEESYPLPSFDLSLISSYLSPKSLFDYLGFPTFDKLRDFLRVSLASSDMYPIEPFYWRLYMVIKDGTTDYQSWTTDVEESYFNPVGLTWLSVPTNGKELLLLSNNLLQVQYNLGTTYSMDNDDAIDYLEPYISFNSIISSKGVIRWNNDSEHTLNFTSPSWTNGTGLPSSMYAPYDTTSGALMPYFEWFLEKLKDDYGYHYNIVDLFKRIESGEDIYSTLLSDFALSPDSLVESYLDYAFKVLLDPDQLVALNGDYSDTEPLRVVYMPVLTEDIPLNLLEFITYWKAIFDWYVNTNIDGDGDDLFERFMDCLADGDPLTNYVKPFVRRWAADYFTSCFPDGSVPAVPIPANPTVLDLRSSNKMQKLEERSLYAGKRPQDQNLAMFGVVSSNSRFDRTEVLSRRIFNIDINSVTQTNQSEWNKALRSPLGSYAGQAISADLGQFLFDYTSEERGMIHVFVSVRPVSSYFQGIPKQMTKVNRFDFLTPILADVGESIVKRRELYFDLGSEDPDEVFGYNRQYAEYMHYASEVHGSFRNSLRHWTGARFIDKDRARLGSSFIGVDPSAQGDDLHRIFATDSDDNILQYLYFHVSAVRPLSRYVNYSL